MQVNNSERQDGLCFQRKKSSSQTCTNPCSDRFVTPRCRPQLLPEPVNEATSYLLIVHIAPCLLNAVNLCLQVPVQEIHRSLCLRCTAQQCCDTFSSSRFFGMHCRNAPRATACMPATFPSTMLRRSCSSDTVVLSAAPPTLRSTAPTCSPNPCKGVIKMLNRFTSVSSFSTCMQHQTGKHLLPRVG